MLDIEAERKLFEARALARSPTISTKMINGRYVDRRLQLRWGGWLDCANARVKLSEDIQHNMELINKEVEDIKLNTEEIRLLRQKYMSGHALPQVDHATKKKPSNARTYAWPISYVFIAIVSFVAGANLHD